MGRYSWIQYFFTETQNALRFEPLGSLAPRFHVQGINKTLASFIFNSLLTTNKFNQIWNIDVFSKSLNTFRIWKNKWSITVKGAHERNIDCPIRMAICIFLLFYACMIRAVCVEHLSSFEKKSTTTLCFHVLEPMKCYGYGTKYHRVQFGTSSLFVRYCSLAVRSGTWYIQMSLSGFSKTSVYVTRTRATFECHPSGVRYCSSACRCRN